MTSPKANYLIFGFMISILLLHGGAIRKDEDPIAKTQTDPIGLKEKLEEIKDGVKGAPTPSFRFYEKEDFLTRSPMETSLEGKDLKPKASKELAVMPEIHSEDAEPFEPEDLGDAQGEAGMKITQEPSVDDEDDWWLEDDTEDSAQK